MAHRERYVPLRVSEVTSGLAELPWSSDTGPDEFRTFGRLVGALTHFEFYDREQAMVAAWDEVGTDPDVASEVRDELSGLLIDANYTEVTPENLHSHINRQSTLPLRLEVDLDDYEVVLVHRRGGQQQSVESRRWRGLRKHQATITVDARVVVLTKVASAASFEERKVDPEDRDLEPGQVSLKQFQNVPRADIEMLLPSTKVKYRLIDTVMMGVPALVSGIVVLATKLLPTLGLMALLAGAWLGLRDEQPNIDQAALVVLFGGLVTIGGFMMRQWTKLKNRRVAYLKILSEILYFRTLSTGPGVLHTLLSTAEQQETVETLLAYRFLAEEPDGLTAEELDKRVEKWLSETSGEDIDFEVDDAVRKVKALGLVTGEEVLHALSLDDALQHLNRSWDALFTYQPARTAEPAGR